MADYTLILTAIVVFGVFTIALKIGSHLDKRIENETPKEKRCPAHKWEWEEQVGMPGTSYIRCQWCRKLPGWGEPK